MKVKSHGLQKNIPTMLTDLSVGVCSNLKNITKVVKIGQC